MMARPEVRELSRRRRNDSPAGPRTVITAARRALVTAIVAASAILAVTMVAENQAGFQFDFRGDLYHAGRAIVSGANPYRMDTLAAEAATIREGRTFGPHASPRWPMPVLVAAVPLSLLPFKLAGWIFLLLSLGGVIAALRIFGVRDWRCSGVACLSWPVIWGVWLGNISPLLLLVAALAWRWRSQARLLGLAVASAFVAKLILGTLAVWLVVTRRLRGLGIAGVVTVVGCLLAWSLVDFADLVAYPHLLRAVTDIGEGRGSSLVSLLISVGLPAAAARIAASVCGAGLLAAAWRVARLPHGDRRAFGLCVMAALMATPVVWSHYFALLFAPIALLSPQLSWMWFLPMLAVLNPAPTEHPAVWANLVIVSMQLVIIARLAVPVAASRAILISRALSERGAAVRPALHLPVASSAARASHLAASRQASTSCRPGRA